MFDTILEYITNADMYYRLWMVGELQNPTPANPSIIKQKFTQPRSDWFPDLVNQFEDVRSVPSLIRTTGGVHHLDGDMRFHIGNRKPSITSSKMEMIWGNSESCPAMTAAERTEFLGVRADMMAPERPMRALGPAHVTLNGLKMWHHQDITHRHRGDAIICDQAVFHWNTKISSKGTFRESGPFQVVIQGFRAAFKKGVPADASFDSMNVSWGNENGIRLGETKVSSIIAKNGIKVNYLLADSVFGDEGEEFIFWDEVGRAQN